MNPQKHRKNIGPDYLAKNRIIDDGKLKEMKIFEQPARNDEEQLETMEIS